MFWLGAWGLGLGAWGFGGWSLLVMRGFGWGGAGFLGFLYLDDALLQSLGLSDVVRRAGCLLHLGDDAARVGEGFAPGGQVAEVDDVDLEGTRPGHAHELVACWRCRFPLSHRETIARFPAGWGSMLSCIVGGGGGCRRGHPRSPCTGCLYEDETSCPPPLPPSSGKHPGYSRLGNQLGILDHNPPR